MDYQILRTELALPAYKSLTAQAAADALNAISKTRPRTEIDGSELLECANVADLLALTAAARDLFLAMIQMPKINIANANVRALLGAMFAAGTTTRTNLVAISTATTAISRATELGLETVLPVDVSRARGGAW